MATLFSLESILLIVLGGILPVFIWLWFWLREDTARPEPKGLILATFLAGGAATFPAFVLEKIASTGFHIPEGVLLFTLWAFIEELMKFLAARLTGEGTRSYDEPVDSLVYLITAALGFAAVENILFLVYHQETGTALTDFILGGNLRFLGANILHAVASGVAGGIMAFAFYRSKIIKGLFALFGLATATLLHSIFNTLIMGSTGGGILITFAYFWAVATLLILLFERVKKITPRYV